MVKDTNNIQGNTLLTDTIFYSPGFSSWTGEAVGKDPDSVAALFSQILRLSVSSGELPVFGRLLSLSGWSAGHGFTFNVEEEGFRFSLFEAVTSWSELRGDLIDDIENPVGHSRIPQFPKERELTQFLRRADSLTGYGFQNGGDFSWRVHSPDSQNRKLEEGGYYLGLCQTDLLLLTHRLPRGRLCFEYGGGSTWMWGTPQCDHLILLLRAEQNESELQDLLRLGEGFLLVDRERG